MKVEEIKAVGMNGFALYGYPILFIERDGKVYRQVFYNPTSDYGYWELKYALDYTAYINSKGNMEEWKPNRHKFILFYDLHAPDKWKGNDYLLFQEDDEYERAIDFAKHYNHLFGGEIIEKTLVVVDVSYEIRLYNARRILDSFEWKKRRDVNNVIDAHRRYEAWQQLKQKETQKEKPKNVAELSKFGGLIEWV